MNAPYYFDDDDRNYMFLFYALAGDRLAVDALELNGDYWSGWQMIIQNNQIVWKESVRQMLTPKAIEYLERLTKLLVFA
jgi:hypothetical protein